MKKKISKLMVCIPIMLGMILQASPTHAMYPQRFLIPGGIDYVEEKCENHYERRVYLSHKACKELIRKQAKLVNHLAMVGMLGSLIRPEISLIIGGISYHINVSGDEIIDKDKGSGVVLIQTLCPNEFGGVVYVTIKVKSQPW